MNQLDDTRSARPFVGGLLLIIGAAIVFLAWLIPSRFNSIPHSVLKEAGSGTDTAMSFAESYLAENNFGVAELLSKTVPESRERAAFDNLLASLRTASPAIDRWGAWDPYLDAAFAGIPLEDYSSQPGMLGVVLSRPCREALSGVLAQSRNPLVTEILSLGQLTTYRRLMPANSSGGRPLEAVLLTVALLAQEEQLSSPVRRELRLLALEAKASGDVSKAEDFFLDILSLARTLDWGQLKSIAPFAQSLKTFGELRYAFHRNPDALPTVYAAALVTENPEAVMDYLRLFGDQGVDTLRSAIAFGSGSVELLAREKLPVDNLQRSTVSGNWIEQRASFFAAFSLKNPVLSLALKYIFFAIGSFIAFYGSSRFSRFYAESSSPVLELTQRLFVSLASLLVLIVLSEPSLASAAATEGYSFKFMMPVLAQVAGETAFVETEPTTSMAPSTILSISFFFLLQVLVFMICVLKVRQIARQDVHDLVKLKLMENEENLFDAGLYVGIAGTCISLVLQILGLIESNLISAYSSNLFGILGVAICKIRLVRPFKSKLILASQSELVALSSKSA